MPDNDDKNKGHTSEPQDYGRSKTEVHEIEHDHKPSVKGVNDREANAPRNNDDGRSHKELQDLEEARSVPASKQG